MLFIITYMMKYFIINIGNRGRIMKFAIITENDESKWEDQTGILYHFPARYKNLLTPGTTVIYYKGGIIDKKYKNKRLSEKQHYFGIAQIGGIKSDPDTPNQFFADIEEYVPFNKAIFFKDENNEYIEVVKKNNHWRDGVREITEEIFIRIVKLANLELKYINQKKFEVNVIEENLPDISSINPELSENLFNTKNPFEKNGNKTGRGSNKYNRFSNNAKKIGDRAEQIVVKLLQKQNMSNIRWVANEGEKPGYDISCENQEGVMMYIEVKGTTTSKFSDFIITANELKVAEVLKEDFYIYFVTDCLSQTPKVQPVRNPVAKINTNEWSTSPISYSVSIT
jgi:Holliday junction resolvase-like predicted endonuclease